MSRCVIYVLTSEQDFIVLYFNCFNIIAVCLYHIILFCFVLLERKKMLSRNWRKIRMTSSIVVALHGVHMLFGI